MFDGEEQMVKLECENYLAGVLIDRFGKEIMILKKDAQHFTVNVNVAVSKQFLGWVFSLGSGIKIIGPDTVVEQMKCEAKRLSEQYL